MIQASDGGLAHVADWIMWLSVNDPKLYAKLPRITVEQALDRASEEWAGTKGAPAPLSRGREETVVATPAGRTWVELLDGTALRAEGSVMSHCVASYESVLGQRRIMSLRDRAGRSIVTVEFRSEAGKPTLWQASAFANTPVPTHAQLCLAHLMQHLGAEGGSAAEAAGITRDQHGAWRRIVEVWNRESWMGMTGVSLGQDLVLMSPRDPSRTLLKVRFASVDWREQNAPVGFVSALEERHFHIDEQRAFAAVLNAVNDDALSSYGPAMVYVDGKAIPARDTMERREIGGVACLVEKGMVGRGNDGLSLFSTRQAGEIIHVVHSRDSARTLLRIEWDHERFRGVLAVHPMDAARWSPGEARRCMAVMTAMKAPFFSASRDTEDARTIQKRYQPVRSMDGRWYSFLEEAQSLPALTGCSGVWRYTGDRAELTANNFGNVVIEKNAFIGHLPNQAVDSVKIDDFGGGYQMGEYLARRGHRRVAHVTGPSFFAEAMLRAGGLEQGLADNGAPADPALRFEGSYLAPSGTAAAQWLLDAHGADLPSVVFFGNYLMASGALAELHDRGIHVPDDLAVAVFGDQPQLEYVRPRLTRVGNAPSELARHATRMLLERLGGKYRGGPRTEVVPCILHPFDTA